MTDTRTALEEWARWQVITAAVFMIDGGIFTFKYPYDTFNFTLPYLGPVVNYMGADVKNSTQFPFALNNPVSGPSFPIAGIIAVLFAPLFLAIELRSLQLPNVFKMLMYGFIGIVIFTQMSLVHSGIHLIVSTILLMINSAAPAKPVNLPK